MSAGILALVAFLALPSCVVGLAALPARRRRPVVKGLFRALLRTVYGVRVRGAPIPPAGATGRVVVANHSSFIDALFLGAFLPGDPVFAVDTGIARRWWARPFLSLADHLEVDPTSPMATKALAREVAAGRDVVIFPEGRLTLTGSLMKVYDGPGLIADRNRAEVVPVRLDGIQHGLFTRLKGRVARHLFPRVTMTVLPPRVLPVDPALRGRDRRKAAGGALRDLMSGMVFETSASGVDLFTALRRAAATHGRDRVAVEDTDGKPMTYGRLIAASLALGAAVRPLAARGEAVGLLLPNSVGAVVAFFGLQAEGRVPAMLNFTAGAAGMSAACRVAGARVVLTSRRFVEKGGLEGVVTALGNDVRVVYLEDVRESVGPAARAAALARSLLPARPVADPDAPAVILFTSGSEGTPKGVVLSHRNLDANRHQVAASIDFGPTDKVLNVLPMFHAFGLTVGTLLPLLAGIRTFLYPSPLHYRAVPEVAYAIRATVLFGTDTFLRNYAKTADPYDFSSVRIVGAGAERVSEETRRTWSDKFGLRILEGYGATETSPVIAFNTPMRHRAGTVGRFMPGVEHRLEPVTGIEGAGRLHVRGPNVMLGYLRDGAPGVLERPEGGWYDTGDIVSVDADGYVTIRGRAKRFAKVAGEMVSLGAVEELAARVSPGHRHAAVARPDPRKGEQVVLASEDTALRRDALVAAAKAEGLPEIMVPRQVLAGSAIPTLGTGKTDYVALAASVSADRAA